jgi:phosphatidylserine/phosphatidylglycerophosphate/cardiolipin synthase-like enzyme
VDVRDRLLGNKGLGHNKFAVVARRQDRTALRAWTGSTNWAATGLCTQLNNGIEIADRKVAKIFLEQWDRLAEAASGFPAELVEANSESPWGSGDIEVWFTRVREQTDLQALIDLVNGAKQSILYVMFQPGGEPLTSILQRASELYVRGVVSTVTSANVEKFRLAGVEADSKEYQTALVQPEGIVRDFSAWVREVTRNLFLTTPHNAGIGHAITHAKMIVIDPASDEDCVVITGSHNFSKSASAENDENFVVIRRNRALAEAYSVACLATYRHYKWRAFVADMFKQGKVPWDHLSTSPDWQSEYLTDARRAHLEMWCR